MKTKTTKRYTPRFGTATGHGDLHKREVTFYRDRQVMDRIRRSHSIASEAWRTTRGAVLVVQDRPGLLTVLRGESRGE